MGLFSKAAQDWVAVHRNVTATLIAMYCSEPKRFATLYARLVLNKKSEVFFFNDERDKRYFIGWGDVALVGVHEEKDAFLAWFEGCESIKNSVPAMVGHTEPYASILVDILRTRAAV